MFEGIPVRDAALPVRSRKEWQLLHGFVKWSSSSRGLEVA